MNDKFCFCGICNRLYRVSRTSANARLAFLGLGSRTTDSGEVRLRELRDRSSGSEVEGDGVSSSTEVAELEVSGLLENLRDGVRREEARRRMEP